MNRSASNWRVQQAVTGYQVVFGASSSASYREAVRLASTLPGYEVDGSGRFVRHRAPIMLRNLATEERLLELVRGWRNAAVTCYGETLDRGALWAMWRVVACYRRHEMSGLEELHCLGLPGAVDRSVPCRLIRGTLPWTYGPAYREADLLPRLLDAHARRALVDGCPAYDPAAVTAAVRSELSEPAGAHTAGVGEDIVFEASLRAARRGRERLRRLLNDIDLNLDCEGEEDRLPQDPA